MTTFKISLSENSLEKLKEIASRYKVAPEELVLASIEELLTRPGAEFQRVLEYVLNNNGSDIF